MAAPTVPELPQGASHRGDGIFFYRDTDGFIHLEGSIEIAEVPPPPEGQRVYLSIKIPEDLRPDRRIMFGSGKSFIYVDGDQMTIMGLEGGKASLRLHSTYYFPVRGKAE